MTPTLIIELTAAAFGVLGTVLLALNGARAGWGFVAFLASNAGWIAFAWMHSHWAMLAQQLAFTVSSLLGVWVWLVKPRKPAARRASKPKPGSRPTPAPPRPPA
jgi:nicotinamide riboside transporter PnuC